MRRLSLASVCLAMAWTSPALADDALIDVGAGISYLHVSTSALGARSFPVTGITARWLYLDGRGEVGFGGRITGFAPAWGKDTDNLGFDLAVTAQFSGAWKDRKVNILPCGGFSVGFRQLFLDTRSHSRYAISGFGADLELGVHGVMGGRSGFYFRLVGTLEGHLLFPDPGWVGGAGAMLTIGIYMD